MELLPGEINPCRPIFNMPTAGLIDVNYLLAYIKTNRSERIYVL